MPRLANSPWETIFRKGTQQGRIAERTMMIDGNHDLSISRQAKILRIFRGSAYYSPCPKLRADLALMRRIDELHLDYPFGGSRMLEGLLLGEGYKVGRLHVRRLMRRMGVGQEGLVTKQQTARELFNGVWALV
jgi:putative transposase